jgi:hypothetical protein
MVYLEVVNGKEGDGDGEADVEDEEEVDAEEPCC